MPLTHLHLELLCKTSSEYIEHQGKISGIQLFDLYKIHYADAESRKSGGQGVWSEPIYFHGTWSCGCADTSHAQNSVSDRVLIPTEAWCKTEICATRGILREGHRLEHVTCDIQGHFFSDQIQIAMEFGSHKLQNKAPSQRLISLFMCKARNVQRRTNSPSYYYVCSDEDIIPCYLAIVRLQRH
ncbi:hypothetical protein BGZ95_007095 [Linnemannia exigua]|uniref:Uncharacterized protein n=1 Tax=Linnemannia exigua TaxID=604196 RepID=A0AAD4DFW7_9FUNG|nr:hypothetical protein BGZ95_007095 [Linnemannia exigua]